MDEGVPIIPLARSETEAFNRFQALARQDVTEVRGGYVEVDLGNYVHVLDKEERLAQIPWIAPTLETSDLIIRLTESKRQKNKRPRTSENYVKRIREDEADTTGSLFVVSVERLPGCLRLKTWFAPFRQENYIQDLLAKGEVIWQPRNSN
jgi:hypothetical protein